MKVLVTGASGFLGSHLVSRLRAQGDWVRALVRPGRGATVDADEVFEGDLRDDDAVGRAVAGVEHVYHAGARVSTTGTWEEFEATNVRGTERLIASATQAGARRIVHVSSLSVYGVPHDGATVTEDSEYETGASQRGFYARSKLEADQRACEAARNGAPVVVMRPGILYGKGRPLLARRVVRLGPLRIIFARRNYLLPLSYVENTVDALCLAARVDRAVGRAYTVVDVNMPQAEYLMLYRMATRQRWIPVFAPLKLVLAAAGVAEQGAKRLGRRPPVSRHQIERTVWSATFNTRRIREELGWEPRVPLEEALLRTLRPRHQATMEHAPKPTRSLEQVSS